MIQIIIILVIISIPIGIIGAIGEAISNKKKEALQKKGRAEGMTRIAEQINYAPELAVQTAVNGWKSGAFTPVEYSNYLVEIAQNTGCVEAMLKLIEYYAPGDSGQENIRADSDKFKYWQMRAAQAGNVVSIMDYFGFSDYDFCSNENDKILSALDNVRVGSDDEMMVVSYLKGIVNFKMGNFATAKQLFASFPSMDHEREYMFFRCLMAEKNMDEAEKVLNELENKEFEVPAGDYLCLYNYYYTEMGATKTDIVKALLFASKYAETKEADHNIANKILGETFYRIAIACQNGSNGFEKDMSQCTESYIKAAEFGNVDAMGYLGMYLWIGRHDEMCIYRDYFQANEYLLKAAQKGHEKSKELLGQYGVDGILVLPGYTERITYQFMDEYKLTASAESMKLLQLHNGITYKACVISDEFVVLYRNAFKSFEDMVNRIQGLYADQVAKMLKWGVQLLMFFNIDMYSANEILDECEDLSLLPRIPMFERELERIDNRAAELHLQTAYAQASRGQWSGSGFGTTIRSTISASVKASVAAGIMNAGSGILHGIGDSIVNSMNNSEIKGMGKKLFENPSTIQEFQRAMLTACLDIGRVIRQIIEEHCNIGLNELEGQIIFGNEELAKIEDKTLNAKLINNLSVKRYEYTYALLIEKLRRFPTDRETLEELFMLTIRRMSSSNVDAVEIDTIKQYAGDFGLDLSEITDKVMQQLEANAGA